MFCTKCGNQLDEGARFCSNCGARSDSSNASKLSNKNKPPVIVLVLAILLVAALLVGAAAMDISRRNEDKDMIAQAETTVKDMTDEVHVETIEPVETVMAVPTVPTSQATTEPGRPAAVTCSVRYADQVSLAGMTRVNVVKGTVRESSTVVQQDRTIDNSGWSAFDGQIETSWQEGVAGGGIGEYIYGGFDRTYQVRVINLLLGNHRSDDWYIKNNTPKTVLINMGGKTFQASFPQEKTEFSLVFSQPIEAGDIKITIDDVHKGTDYADTIIAEVNIYGY